jgi:Tol biopolymer transport system component
MLDLSGSRLFAWVPGSVYSEYQQSVVLVDTAGKETPVDLPKGQINSARASMDGRRLLVSHSYPGKQVELLDLSSGARRNVTFEANPFWPMAIWGPGPDRITFVSGHEGPVRIYSRRVDAGAEEIETLWKGSGTSMPGLGSWSRDGKTLAFIVYDSLSAMADIWLIEPGKEPRRFFASRFEENAPDISPDGRWLAYSSDEPGKSEVFVRPLSGEGPARMVSVGGGAEPLWARDGTAIFYRWRTPRTPAQPAGARARFRVRVDTAGGRLAFGPPEKLFEDPYEAGTPGTFWDVTPDGRFVMLKEPDETERRARFEKTLGDRIYVDTEGFPALLEGAGKSR